MQPLADGSQCGDGIVIIKDAVIPPERKVGLKQRTSSAIVDDMDGIFLLVVRFQNVFGAAIRAADTPFGGDCDLV